MKTQDSIIKAADLLIKARLENKLISLPDELRPISIEEGYQIQDAIIEEIGVQQCGWKVAITNDELMLKAHVNEPISGPLFEKWISSTPNIIKHGLPSLVGFEFEFAFTMGKDLYDKGEDYTPEEVKNAVATLHPAIEIIGARYNDFPKGLGVQDIIADHCNNYSFVYGKAVPEWEKLNLADCEVVALFDNREINRNTGANVLGTPLNSLTWLVNHLITRGHHVKAGDWITTGAAVGPLPKSPSVKVTADFGDLGKVLVEYEN
jgi:2-keto-4-pentenoate hydratase